MRKYRTPCGGSNSESGWTHHETVRRRKDGELIDVSNSYSPIKDAAGDVVGSAVITHSDVTERKRAEREIHQRERQITTDCGQRAGIDRSLGPEQRFKFVNKPYAERLESTLGNLSGEVFKRCSETKRMQCLSRTFNRCSKASESSTKPYCPIAS